MGGREAPRAARSLVVASLELGRVLADRGKITFRAQGTCMFPCVQPGDILHIESRTIEQVQIGEIAVFRREDALFGHRTIAAGAHDGSSYIVTRSDRSGTDDDSDDGPIYGKDVLGVVTAIERRGARMPLHPQSRKLRGVTVSRAAAREWWNTAVRPRLIERIGALQRRTLYRYIASACFRLVPARYSFVVRVPLNPLQSHDLYRELTPDAFDLSRPSWQGKPIARWILALHLNAARRPAGTATFVWQPPECPRGAGWRLDTVQTRARYRGAGLEEALLRRAEPILRSGACVDQERMSG